MLTLHGLTIYIYIISICTSVSISIYFIFYMHIYLLHIYMHIYLRIYIHNYLYTYIHLLLHPIQQTTYIGKKPANYICLLEFGQEGALRNHWVELTSVYKFSNA